MGDDRSSGGRTNSHLYYEKIEQVLTDCGYERTEPHTFDFDAAFVRENLFTSQAFLIKKVESPEFKTIDAEQIVGAGRAWCANHLNASFLVNEAGMNLVLLHEGQVNRTHIKGHIDASGLHGAICQSITALDATGGTVKQERTWVVIGRVRRALNRISGIG